MRRREFLGVLGGAAAAWPLAARAQTERMRRIGVLMGSADNVPGQTRVRAFQQSLAKLGWSEGRNLTIEYRWAEGRSEPLAPSAAELVRLKVEVIVSQGTPPTVAAMQATSVIPIVTVGAGDPVGAGLVASLARPGGNVTGTSNQSPDLAGKRLELLREIVPGLDRVGILVNTDNPAAMLDAREVETAAKALGTDVARLETKRAEDIAPALDAFRAAARAVYVVLDPFTTANALRINTLALGARLPTMYGLRNSVEIGGLISYGTDFQDLWRDAAGYVDKILRGAKPAHLPVEQPTKFELVVNLKTAKALGLTIPEIFLARASKVIE